jgi:hypothetical protein
VGKFIPVEPEKWAEMVKAMAENARLKTEVERLTSDIQMEKENEDRLVREWQKANNEVYGLQTQVAALIDDQTRLKAKVERLEVRIEYVDNLANRYALDDVRSQAHIERLTKAGDMMYSWLGVCGRRNNSFGDDWLRAKKGAMLQAEQFDRDMKNRGWTGWQAAKEGKQS